MWLRSWSFILQNKARRVNSSQQVTGLKRRETDEAAEAMWTHHVLTDTARADLEVVPRDEQDQEEGQHVELPVPHSEQEHLQARSHRGLISVGVNTPGVRR